MARCPSNISFVTESKRFVIMYMLVRVECSVIIFTCSLNIHVLCPGVRGQVPNPNTLSLTVVGSNPGRTVNPYAGKPSGWLAECCWFYPCVKIVWMGAWDLLPVKKLAVGCCAGH